MANLTVVLAKFEHKVTFECDKLRRYFPDSVLTSYLDVGTDSALTLNQPFLTPTLMMWLADTLNSGIIRNAPRGESLGEASKYLGIELLSLIQNPLADRIPNAVNMLLWEGNRQFLDTVNIIPEFTEEEKKKNHVPGMAGAEHLMTDEDHDQKAEYNKAVEELCPRSHYYRVMTFALENDFPELAEYIWKRVSSGMTLVKDNKFVNLSVCHDQPGWVRRFFKRGARYRDEDYDLAVIKSHYSCMLSFIEQLPGGRELIESKSKYMDGKTPDDIWEFHPRDSDDNPRAGQHKASFALYRAIIARNRDEIKRLFHPNLILSLTLISVTGFLGDYDLFEFICSLSSPSVAQYGNALNEVAKVGHLEFVTTFVREFRWMGQKTSSGTLLRACEMAVKHNQIDVAKYLAGLDEYTDYQREKLSKLGL